MLDADPKASGTWVDALAVSVSISRPGECLPCAVEGAGLASVSTQSAGVGGTGPSDVTPLGGGRRVGGEMIGTTFLSTLWTL